VQACLGASGLQYTLVRDPANSQGSSGTEGDGSGARAGAAPGGGAAAAAGAAGMGAGVADYAAVARAAPGAVPLAGLGPNSAFAVLGMATGLAAAP
jgi:hypothetical protein